MSFVSFIHQRSSWGYLQLSKETLQKLLSTHKLSPIIIDAIFSFGAKVTNDDDPYFNLCHRQVCSLDTIEASDDGHYYGPIRSIPPVFYITERILQIFAISLDASKSMGDPISNNHGP